MIKSILTAAAITMASSPVMAANYDSDVVTFSSSAVCSELVGFKTPTEATDAQWKNYLKCVEVMHYFNTKY